MQYSAYLHLIDNITVKNCLTNFFLCKNQLFLKKNAFSCFFCPKTLPISPCREFFAHSYTIIKLGKKYPIQQLPAAVFVFLHCIQ